MPALPDEGLSDEVKALIEERTATHDLLFDFGDRIAPERRAAMAAQFPPHINLSFALTQKQASGS